MSGPWPACIGSTSQSSGGPPRQWKHNPEPKSGLQPALGSTTNQPLTHRDKWRLAGRMSTSQSQKPARYERADVAAAVAGNVPIILCYWGHKCTDHDSETKCGHCPDCGPRTRADSVAINNETGAFYCHAHGCHGSVFDLVAGYAGLGRDRFPEALRLAAEILGVGPAATSPHERAKQRGIAQERTAAQQAKVTAEKLANLTLALKEAPLVWQCLQSRNAECEGYMVKRGLAALVGCDSLVRFAPIGADTALGYMLNHHAVCVPVYDFDGSQVNVVARAIAPIGDRPKVIGLPQLNKRGSFGRCDASRIRHDGITNVVIVEGVFDDLTARLVWPTAMVLGGDGASELYKIAAAVAPAIAASSATLTLVPHRDRNALGTSGAGQRGVIQAGKAAIHGGVRLDRIKLERLRANDLNDAWQVGWRPTHE